MTSITKLMAVKHNSYSLKINTLHKCIARSKIIMKISNSKTYMVLRMKTKTNPLQRIID